MTIYYCSDQISIFMDYNLLSSYATVLNSVYEKCIDLTRNYKWFLDMLINFEMHAKHYQDKL